MYRGSECIESARLFLEKLRQAGVPYYFLTNNAMRTRAENAEHMRKMGYTGIEPAQFYNSAMAAASWARDNLEGNRAAYIGAAGLEEALQDEGFIIDEEHPDAVFVGLDPKAGYADYSRLIMPLLQGARLIGTNKDRILARPGDFDAGNGSVVALFEYASGQTSPDIAKPSPEMLKRFLKYTGLKAENIVLVGDNLETDIALGYNTGVETVLTETGVHTRADIREDGPVPDHIVSSLAEIDAEAFL